MCSYYVVTLDPDYEIFSRVQNQGIFCYLQGRFCLCFFFYINLGAGWNVYFLFAFVLCYFKLSYDVLLLASIAAGLIYGFTWFKLINWACFNVPLCVCRTMVLSFVRWYRLSTGISGECNFDFLGWWSGMYPSAPNWKKNSMRFVSGAQNIWDPLFYIFGL